MKRATGDPKVAKRPESVNHVFPARRVLGRQCLTGGAAQTFWVGTGSLYSGHTHNDNDDVNNDERRRKIVLLVSKDSLNWLVSDDGILIHQISFYVVQLFYFHFFTSPQLQNKKAHRDLSQNKSENLLNVVHMHNHVQWERYSYSNVHLCG